MVRLWSKIVENKNVNFSNVMRDRFSKDSQVVGGISGFELLALQQ
jgi:hypothetical protein